MRYQYPMQALNSVTGRLPANEREEGMRTTAAAKIKCGLKERPWSRLWRKNRLMAACGCCEANLISINSHHGSGKA